MCFAVKVRFTIGVEEQVALVTKTRMKLLYILILGWQILSAQSQGIHSYVLKAPSTGLYFNLNGVVYLPGDTVLIIIVN